MVCHHDRMVVEVNQGCPRGFSFTLLQDEQPMDLTNLTVLFQVKISPYFKLPSLIEKEVTEDSDRTTVGVITDPTQGVFQIQLTMEDTLKLPPDDYPLMITIVDKDTRTNISSDGNYNAVFRVCHQ